MDTISEVKRKTITGVISYTLRTTALYAISVLATGLLSAYLNPAEFGTYYIVTAIISLLTFLSDIGLAATLVQKKTEPTIEELRTTFTIQQLLAVTIITIVVLGTPIWKQQSHLNQYGLELLYALSFSFILASLKTIPSIILERKLEFGKLVIPQIVESIAFYGLAVWFAAHGWGIRSYTIAVIVRSIAGLITIYMIQQWPIGFALAKEHIPHLLRFGAKFQLNDLLARIKDDLFIVVLAKFITSNDMGFIGWAKRWSLFPYQFSVNNVVSITFPTFSRLQENRQLLSKALEKSIFFISLLIFPILGGMVVIAHPLTQLIPSYHKWQPAIPYLIFFCLNIAFAAIANPIINALNAIGKIQETLKLMLVMTAVTWVVTPLSMYLLGTIGIAVTSAVVAALSLYAYRIMSSQAEVRVFSMIWKQGFSTIIMIGILTLLDNWLDKSWLHLGAGIILAALTYTISMLAVGYRQLVAEIQSLK